MKTKRTQIGDRVQIMGFTGTFEVVQLRQGGLVADLKHLGSPGPDYIEKEIFSCELIYPNPPHPPPRHVNLHHRRGHSAPAN
jgi:hypothetical protein